VAIRSAARLPRTFTKDMNLFVRITFFFALLLSGAAANDRSPITILGAFHDPSNESIVFSVHYLRGKEFKEKIVMPAMGVYIKIDGKKYPINSHDTMISDSHTSGQNVIDEYSLRGYKVLGGSKEIPKLRQAKSVIFGLDYTVNDKIIKLEKEVPLTLYTKQAE